MKKILGSLLLASFALVPVTAVLADESTSTATTTTTVATTSATSTRYGEGLKNWIDTKKTELKTFQKEVKNQIKDKKAEVKDLRKASSTATSTKNEGDKQENNRYGDKFKIDIASTTQKLLDISNKLGTLGTQIKAIVAGQASSSDAVATAVNKEEGRGFFQRFLFGADPKNLGMIISQVSTMQARISQLDKQISKMASSTDKTALVANVQTLKDQIATLEQYVKDNINKFSLFGWLNNYNKQN